MQWPTLADAVIDLRTLLSDGPTDKFASMKKLFVNGKQDGVNKMFKTFERRRVTDFTTAAAPLGVLVSGVFATVDTDYTATGDLILHTAPINTDTVVGSYYYQWWIDTELQVFLKNATQWLGMGADVTVVPDGLQPAALHYAGQEAFHKLAMWWSIRMSETYKLEDAPPKAMLEAQKSFMSMAEVFEKKSQNLRKQFYTRQDQAEAPLFATMRGNVRDYLPRR